MSQKKYSNIGFTLFALVAVSPSFAVEESKLGLHHESEAGLVSVSGNSRAQTIAASQKTSYSWTSDLLRNAARYTRTSSQGIEAVKNWLISLGYERSLSSDISVFANQTTEGNKYSGFLQRHASDLGGKKSWFNSDQFQFFNELGYRYQRQNNTNGTILRNSYGRIYGEALKRVTQSFKISAWFEYLPNFTNSTDWQFNTELAGIAQINSIFSIKTAYLIRFDNLPSPGIEYKSDRTFTTSLVASF